MIFSIVSTALLALAMQDAPRTLPPGMGPLRNTFVVAAETVIDNASAVDLKGDDAHFAAQMNDLKTSKENLLRMAEDDREHDAAEAANDLIFAVASCHIRAKNGDAGNCVTLVDNARHRAMEALGKHKANGAWVNGPPTGIGR